MENPIGSAFQTGYIKLTANHPRAAMCAGVSGKVPRAAAFIKMNYAVDDLPSDCSYDSLSYKEPVSLKAQRAAENRCQVHADYLQGKVPFRHTQVSKGMQSAFLHMQQKKAASQCH